MILSPWFVIIVIMVKLGSPGTIIYSQERVGLNGRRFRLYKFRSMIVNADKVGTSVTTGNDTRITKIGRFLRKIKLDELPQLWNVLKGDMSFVGPRPDVPEIVNKYSPEMRRILNVRPGITSNATLYLRNEEDLLSLADTWSDINLKEYVQNGLIDLFKTKQTYMKSCIKHLEKDDKELWDKYILQ